MTTGIEAALAALSGDPALAGSMAPGAAIVLWNDNVDRVLWASPRGAAITAAAVDATGHVSPDQPLGARLQSLAAELRASGEARVERLRFDDDASDVPGTLMCRMVDLDGGQALATIMLEPFRGIGGSAEPEPRVASEESGPEAGGNGPAEAPVTALLDRIRRQGVRRFIWSMDRDGRFLSVSHPLAEVVGRQNADIVDRRWAEIAGRLVLDGPGRITELLERRATWSDETVLWRITDTAYVVPVDLGGMPVFGREHAFEGFRGFGLCRTEEAREVEAEAVVPGLADRVSHRRTASPPAEPIDERDDASAYGALQARVGAQLGARPLAIRTALEPDVLPEADPVHPILSMAERGALHEIARALGARLEADAGRDAAPGRGSAEIVPMPTTKAKEPDALRIFERMPIGILVLRGEAPLYANRFVLDLLGFRDRSELADKGGVARLFAGRVDTRAKRGSDPTPLVLTARTGSDVAVEVRLSTVEWGDAPASLLLVRPASELAGEAEQRGLRRELARRDAQLREAAALLDVVPAAVVTLDGSGRILGLNGPAERLFGYAQNEVAGESYAILLAPESHREALDLIAGAHDPDAAERALSGRARDGRALPLGVTARPLDGSAALALVARDLSPSRRDDADVRAAKRAAETAATRQSAFLARVNHEIRTPINAILGFTEIMLEERFGPVGNERYRGYLRDVHRSGDHVVSLVNDLLDLAKVESGKTELSFTCLDLGDVVGQSVGLMRALAEQGRIILRTALPAGLPRVVADERSIRQIALNLVSNAIRFTEAGGQVIVSATATDDGGVSLRVRDTGIGMNATEVEAALEPFRQVSPAGSRGGTGLGLPLAKALAEANRSTFTLTSARDSGTLAEVVFPPSRVLAD